MAVAYRSSSATGSSDALVSSVNVPVPSGAAANDIAIVAIEQFESFGAAITPASGFTEKLTVEDGVERMKVFWKRLTGSDSGSYTFSWSGSIYTMAHCILMTGAKTSGDPFGSNTNTASTSSGTSIPSTSVTTSYQPGLVHFVANANTASQTPPSSYTEVQDGDYLHTNYRIPGSTGTHSTSGGSLSATTTIVAALLAVEPASSGQSAAANTATESDSAQAFGKTKRRTANAATETDTAVSFGRKKARTVSLSQENDTAIGFSRSKARSLGMATSVEVALPIGRIKTRAVGTAQEAESAFAIGKAKSKALGRADESDTAIPFGSVSGISVSVGTATETEIALPIGYRRSKAIGTATETSTAQPINVASVIWRLVMPTIREVFQIKGSLRVNTFREVTVFGDDDGLFTSNDGDIDVGGDSWGAIPFDSKYVWLGGHVNTTTDPAVRDLWLASGFEVDNVAA